MYPGHWSSLKPEALAVTLPGPGGDTVASLTWKQLDDRSNQIARFFSSQGLREGDHVAVFLENNLVYFEVAWAALRSGLHMTPVNRYLTAEEAGYIIDDCDAKACVASARLAEVAQGLPHHAPRCTTWLMTGGTVNGFQDYEKLRDSTSAARQERQPLGALMFYSSGTTGRPKGIHRSLPGVQIDEIDETGARGTLQALLWGFGPETTYLSPAPLYHSAPISFCLAVQTLGGHVIVLPRFDALDALAAIEKHRVTHSQWVPTMFSRMLKLDEQVRGGFDLSSHKTAIHAAAPCPQEVKQQMMDWWGPIIYEYYAGSELNGFTHVTPEEWLERPGTVGKSLMGTIHICDESGKPLDVREPGMIYFEQPEVEYAYFKDEQKTKDSQHPEHANWTTLGDVGYLDEEGYLYLTDRATFMIVSGGVNIYPQEIEDLLILHPKVEDVAVIGVPNEEMGEEVKAVVQLAEDVEPSEKLSAELIELTRERLAHYKCPKSVDFDPQLPRLPTGKLYKRLLKDRYWGKHDSRIV